MKVKLPHVNKKPLLRKQIFVRTRCSHSTLKLVKISSREKIFQAAQITCFFAPLPVSTPLPVSFCEQNHHFHYLKKHENVLTDLKKRQRPDTIQIL